MACMRFQHFGLLGILWLPVFCIVGGLEMYTVDKVLATCGDNVTLPCNITTEVALDIKEFKWMEKNDICHWGVEKNLTSMQCANVTSQNSYDFPLTIFNIQPEHKGTYHCKLRSKEGTKNGQTIVRVQKCVGDALVNVSSAEGTCLFEGVYPKPTVVLWKQGHDESVQHWSKTDVKENADGFFTAVSTIKLRNGRHGG
uniref:Ig-like domain-containing protein n=1 Tax=Knipowitschia caucasica TaxID=637954 RepID=A0AAV2KL25_KNICA